MGRGNGELLELFRGRALTVGGTTRFSQDLPVGEGWNKLILGFNHVVTIGTGAGPLAEGGLRAVRGITLRSDRGDVFVANVPGRPLYRWDATKAGTPGPLDAILAANGTYRALLSIWFWDPLAAYPMDTIIDTSRFNTMSLEVEYGGVADLYSAPGTATVAPTLDLVLDRTRGPLADKVKPLFAKEYGVRPPVVPSAATLIDLERAANLSYQRLMAYTTENATAGVPFTGDADADTVRDWTVDTDKAQPFLNLLQRMVTGFNRDDYGWEAAVAGLAVFDFCGDGSLNSAMLSGDKSRLRLQWVNDTLGAVAPQVSLAYEGFRTLK